MMISVRYPAPNESQVQQLFGKYAGTVRIEGLRWTHSFYPKQRISRRVRNFKNGKLNVNENDGNPIEIGIEVVWQVLDSAETVFCVDDYESYVHIQSESALRQMA
jgi:regulator of protease activity HflC (stomatin/prohibitin superfamily)